MERHGLGDRGHSTHAYADGHTYVHVHSNPDLHRHADAHDYAHAYHHANTHNHAHAWPGHGARHRARGKGFKPRGDGTVVRVGLHMRKVGSPDDNVTVEIRTDNGGLPSG